MYILDTDHASLYQQGHPALGRRLDHLPPNQLATTIITYDEQLAGRLAVVHKARNRQERIQAYYWLQRTLHFFCCTSFVVCQYSPLMRPLLLCSNSLRR